VSPLLYFALALVRGWTTSYTSGMEPESRERRRAEIESDLWEFHEDARRRGYSPEGVAIHVLGRLLIGMPQDVLWRLESEEEAPMTPRRSAWITAAAIGAAVSVGALWAFFAVTSLVSLPPLPDSIHVERIYLRPMPPPPPPPPSPPPGAMRMTDGAPPPPPPPPSRGRSGSRR
jgi:hypothetical protein